MARSLLSGPPPSQAQRAAMAAAYWLSVSATEEEAIAGFRSAHPTYRGAPLQAVFNRARQSEDVAETIREELKIGDNYRLPNAGVARVLVTIYPEDEEEEEILYRTIYIPYAAGTAVDNLNKQARVAVATLLLEQGYEFGLDAFQEDRVSYDFTNSFER
jgi:hypothetical protein